MASNSNCTGVIHVNEHTRSGFPVEAYDRKCSRHKGKERGFWRTEDFVNGRDKEGTFVKFFAKENTENGDNIASDEYQNNENQENTDENTDDTSKNNETEDKEEDKNALLEEAFNFIVNGEGSVQGIYADTKGNLTVGYGTNVNRKSDFMKVEFRDTMKQGHILNAGEKSALFDKAQAEKMNVNWGALATKTNSQESLKDLAFITKDEAKALAIESINTSLKEVQGMAERFGINFNTLPPSAKVGVLDMHYNLGGTKFNPSKFPKFFEGLRQKNYQYSGVQSHRTGIGEKRNNQVREKFNKAQQEHQRHERYGRWR